MPGFISSIFSFHFCTSGHDVQKSLFSCIWGIFFLPADFPAVKGIIHFCIRRDFHVVQMLHIVLDVKSVFLVIIGQLLVPAMLRYIEFIREEWSDASKELPENNLRILFRVNLIKSVNFATGLRRLFGGIS